MRYMVSREKVISATQADVFKYLVDFTNWHLWSPWACIDPLTKVTCNHECLAWESKFTGIGNMTKIAQTENSIDISLKFIKPFKSQAKVSFTLIEPSHKTTKVIWRMESKLPWFLFFWKKMFQVMIGRDFERGLNRLKYLVETANVPCRIEFIDEPQRVPGFKIAGISAKCAFADIATSMDTTFGKLQNIPTIANLTPIKMACLYDKISLCKETMHYIAAIICKDQVMNAPELINREIPDHKALKVILYGNYDFMADAWSGICAHVRGLKLKADKRIAPYDIYVKAPNNTDNPNEYVTEIYMPVR